MLWLDQLKQSDHKHLLLTLEGEESPDINQKENVVTCEQEHLREIGSQMVSASGLLDLTTRDQNSQDRC